MISPVSLEGHNGLDEDTPAGNAAFHASLDRWKKDNPGQNSRPEALRLIALSDTLRRYNTLRPRLLEEEIARQERDRALQWVETRWSALSTAPAWLAAHHAYVLAVNDARIAIDMWQDRAANAKKIVFVYDSDSRKAAYDQILAAGHPPAEPLTIDPDAIAQELLANLDQAHEYRTRLAAETAGLLQKAGAI